MENLKIKVNSESESKEVQELFFELGYRDRKNWTQRNPAHESIQAWKDGEFTFSLNHNQVPVGFEETTLQELRDMVVLKRNDPKDATHESDVDDCDELYFIDSNKNLYRWFCGSHWVPAVSYKGVLKLIKDEVVKEYLFKYNDQYTLVELSKEDAESNPEQYIEIPDGAEILTVIFGGNVFYKSGTPWKWYSGESKRWMDCSSVVDLDGFDNSLWQRESLNNKIATAEVARQESKSIDATLAERQLQYGCFEDVAFVTENIMSILSKVRPNGLQELPNTHRMALYMIASKMARIVNGDFNHKDSWHDIGGYSKLIEDLIGDNNEL